MADFINIPPAGQFLYRPECVIPTAAHNPFAGLCGFHASANTIAKFGQRLRSNQIYGEALETGVGQVQMRIVESGHHEMVVQINDLSFGSLQLQNLAFFPHVLNTIAADGHGLHALNRVKGRCDGDPGINVAVEENGIRSRRRWLILCQGH